MLWIIGGDHLVHAFAATSGYAWAQSLSGHMRHAFVDGMTRGFHFYDLIFPLFIFLTGVALPLSVGRRLERGESKRSVSLRIIRRGLLLVLLGLVYNGILDLEFAGQRYWSVLGRIGLAYMVAALLYTYCRPWLFVAIGGAILLAYGILFAYAATPGFEAGDMTREGNTIGYLDRTLLPRRLYPEALDPEGPTSTLPAATNAMMGALAGTLLFSPRRQPREKVALLVAGGLAALGLGWGLSPAIPVMKDLWTSTYALVAAGWSLLSLALFYVLFDVFKFYRLGFVFTVIGANAITIYMMYRIVDFQSISHFFFTGIARRTSASDGGQALVIWSGVLVIEWLLLLLLYRHRIFLRV